MQTQTAGSSEELVKEVMKLFDLWDLPYEERAALLGVAPEMLSRLFHDRLVPSADVIGRIHCLFAINDALHSLFGENPEIDYNWPTCPNPDLAGRKPVEVMAGGVTGLKEILAYLERLMTDG